MDLNMDVRDITALFKQSPSAEMALFSFGPAGALTLAVTLACFGWGELFWAPYAERAVQLAAKLEENTKQAEETPGVRANIRRMRKDFVDRHDEYARALERFYNNAADPGVTSSPVSVPPPQVVTPDEPLAKESAFGEAFRRLTEAAKQTDMIVLSAQKADLTPELSAGLLPAAARRVLEPKLLPITLRVKGSYPHYLSFLRKLVAGTQLHSVVRETVELSKDERYFGYVEAEFTLAAYALDKDGLTETLASLGGKAAGGGLAAQAEPSQAEDAPHPENAAKAVNRP